MKQFKPSEPLLTLSELYGNNIVYNARPPYEDNPWLSIEEHKANFSTGRELLIADKTPVIVHKASITNKLTDLFKAAEINPSMNFLTFDDLQSYEKLLKKTAYSDKKQIYFQYVHNSNTLHSNHYVVDKNVFLKLNNKSRLSEWTKGKYLPEREIVATENFKERIKEWSFPFVIKPGDDSPTSGGYGVMICYNNDDLIEAQYRIYKSRNVTTTMIIEKKIEEKANFCVQYAYSLDNGIIYLGATEQLTNLYGYYKGNHTAYNVPLKVIQAGKDIMELGVENGYFGIAGFDLLIDENDEIYAIDLNFRQNGSTSLLLLEPFLQDGYHKFYNYISEFDNDHFFNIILKYINKGVLFPIAYYDGDWFTKEKVKSRFSGIWHGGDKYYIQEMEDAFFKEINKVN